MEVITNKELDWLKHRITELGGIQRDTAQLQASARGADELQMSAIMQKAGELQAREMQIKKSITQWQEDWRLAYQPEATLSALASNALQGVLTNRNIPWDMSAVQLAKIAFDAAVELKKLLDGASA